MTIKTTIPSLALCIAALAGGCIIETTDDADTPSGDRTTGQDPVASSSGGMGDESGSNESSGTAAGDDSGSTGSSGTWGSTSTGEAICDAEPVSCEDGGDDPAAAMGLCKATPGFVSLEYIGSPAARGVRMGLGEAPTHDPREGTQFAVIGSGEVEAIDSGSCSTDLGEFDPLNTLPAPILTVPVEGKTSCLEDPSLVGTGDCSRTIDGQFSQGMTAHDMTGIQVEFTVPEGVNSLQFDVAFFSTEYPDYYGQPYNDMFIGYVQSDSWTGNVSFDEIGNPISLNAGFLDFQDDDYDLPEFAGTCFEGHGGTRWLRSTTQVVPGETLTLVVAVYDLADSIIDSYAFLDNFRWSCEMPAGPLGEPHTEPVD